MLKTILLCLIFLFIGMIVGYAIHSRGDKGGRIILDKNEDGDDRILFDMNLNYDDFKKYSHLTFEIINKMQKN